MKPIIGITTHSELKTKGFYCLVSQTYISSVYAAGGVPIMLSAVNAGAAIAEYLPLLDGLLLTGGEDVCPLLYGENPLKEVEVFNRERDEFEMRLFREALQENLPVLGICRGLQVMNTALGGTLYQDLSCQIEGSLGHFPRLLPVDSLYHTVRIQPHSRLADIFSSHELEVNSYHHQAVKQIAGDFIATAWSTDDIIEAIEHKEKDFVMAVQWHPEDLTVKYPVFLHLFSALVNAANRKRMHRH